MSPAPFPNFRWFFRTVRMLPLIAAAALGGGIIGGGAIFAIDLALTSPPQQNAQAAKDVQADKSQAPAATPAPVRVVDTPKPDTPKPDTPKPTSDAPKQTSPTADITHAAPAAPPAPAQTVPVTQSTAIGVVNEPAQPVPASAPAAGTSAAPQNAAITAPPTPAAELPEAAKSATAKLPEKGWPDALSRQHPAAAAPPATPAVTETNVKPVESVNNAPAETVPNTPAAADRAVEPPKKRVVKKTVRPAPPSDENASIDERPNTRRVYDYYGRDDERDVQRAARPAGRSNTPPPRVIVRRRDMQDADRSDDDRVGLPPQPPPARSGFFGLFGGDRYEDDRN